MKPLAEALFAKIEGSALETALTGGLYYRLADRGAFRPYGVIEFPAGHTAPSAFDMTRDSVVVQLSLYAQDNETMDDLFQACMDTLDGCVLDVEGFLSHPLEREAPPRAWPEDEAFHGVMEYRINLEKGA